ncbi:H/ACA ribonucleoprotein complex non-core subunit NAF1 [Venturia canescens]|uniref:H/ACA ribonucleoprotein complex non-core subunit NAF1 n=1 Tax=Venturia canescens TaxID=32260 RepID=UPI001C9D02BB|nr:H/ACA ribonucleoprotein complex non-core subunit NAF1 [Venturia canescens]
MESHPCELITNTETSENHHEKVTPEKPTMLPPENLSDETLNTDTTTISTEDVSSVDEIVDKIMSERMESAPIEICKPSDTIPETVNDLPNTETLTVNKGNSENSFEIGKSAGRSETEAKVEILNANASLAFLAVAYNSSDSENEDIEELDKKIANDSVYRIDSTICASDSDICSSEESNNSEPSDDESGDNQDDEETKKKLGNGRNKMRERETKGEFDDLPPIEELQIVVPEVLCDPLGEVGWMAEQMVVVKPKPEKPTLNLDTILFLDRGRRVLGRIFDVFGQVSEPHYCVRFNSSEHITQSQIKIGMIVYFCPNTPYTSLVFLHDLLKMKATEEISDQEHPEFSDDAEEKAYYAALNKKSTTEENPKKLQNKRRKMNQGPGWKSNHPWSSGRNPEMKNHKYDETTEGLTNQDQNSQNQGQRNVGWHQNAPPHFWQYPPSYNGWPAVGPRGENNWQNPYSGQHAQQQSPQLRGMQIPPNPYVHNMPPYQNNAQRFPMPNFQWHSHMSRFPGYSWPGLPPPPPPGV